MRWAAHGRRCRPPVRGRRAAGGSQSTDLIEAALRCGEPRWIGCAEVCRGEEHQPLRAPCRCRRKLRGHGTAMQARHGAQVSTSKYAADAIRRTSPSFFLVDAIRWRLARSCWGRRRTSTRSVRRWRDASARAVTSLNGSAPLVSGPRCSASVCRTRSLRTTSCSTFHGRVGGARQRWRLGVARAMSRLLSASAPPPPTATAPRPIVICARRRSSTSALHATSARRRRWAACVSPRCWIRGCGTARSVIAPLRSPRPSNRSSRSAVPHAHRAR